MALNTPVLLDTATPNTTAGITSNSFTPTSQSMLMAVDSNTGPATANTGATITDSAGLTWTLIFEVGQGNTTGGIRIWWARSPSSPSAMTVTTTLGGTPTHHRQFIYEVTSTTSLAQLKASSANTGTGTTATTPQPSAGVAPATGDQIHGWETARNLNAVMTLATSYTNIAEQHAAAPSATTRGQYRTGTTSAVFDPSGMSTSANEAGVFIIEESSGGTGWTAGETASSGLTDTTAFDQTKPTTDDSGLTDTSTPSVGRGLADPMDSTGSTDTQIVSVGRGLADPLDSSGLTDTNRFDQGKATIDDTGLTDSVVIVHGIFIAQTDDSGLTDSATEQLNAGGTSFTAGETASAGLTDTTAFAQGKATTDDSGLTDTSIVSKGANGVSVDSSGLTDSALLSSAFSRAITDPAGLTDPVVFVVGRGASQTDVVGLTDSVVISMSRALTIMDIAGMTETTVVVDSGSVTYRVKFGALKPRVGIGAPKGRVNMGDLKARISIGAPKL